MISSSSDVKAAARALSLANRWPTLLAPAAHRSALQRVSRGRPRWRRKAARLQIAGEIGQSEPLLDVDQMLEEPRPLGPRQQHTDLLGGQPGGQEVPDPALPVDRRDLALSGAGRRTSALDHLLEHRVQVQARVDAQHRAAQPREAVPKSSVLPPQLAQLMQCFSRRSSLIAGEIRIFHGIVTSLAPPYTPSPRNTDDPYTLRPQRHDWSPGAAKQLPDTRSSYRGTGKWRHYVTAP